MCTQSKVTGIFNLESAKIDTILNKFSEPTEIDSRNE